MQVPYFVLKYTNLKDGILNSWLLRAEVRENIINLNRFFFEKGFLVLKNRLRFIVHSHWTR